MSDTEKAEFKKDIEKALIKKWWPVVAFMVVFGLFLIKGTYWFDNNIATKNDTSIIAKDVQEVKKDISDIKNSLYDGREAKMKVDLLKGHVDTLDGVISHIQRVVAVKFVTESYPNGYNGRPKLNPVN